MNKIVEFPIQDGQKSFSYRIIANSSSSFKTNPTIDSKVAFNWRNSSVLDYFAILCANENDVFLCCTWANNLNQDPILIVGTTNGAILEFDCREQKISRQHIGHGGPIRDVKMHPTDDTFLFSCSDDHSIRIWNRIFGTVVAIFGGFEGHCNPVVCIDIHPIKDLLLSSGNSKFVNDSKIMIWDLKQPKVKEAMEKSLTFNPANERKPFPTAIIPRRTFGGKVHENSADSDDFILSKSKDLMIWAPTKDFPERLCDHPQHNVSFLYRLKPFPQTTPLRIDILHQLLIGGDNKGRLLIFPIDNIENPITIPAAESQIVGVDISFDRRTIIAFHSDKSITKLEYYKN